MEARDLACARGGRMVFAGVSFVARPGQMLAVTGANGAGKTSLLRIVAGLLAPASGTLCMGDAEDPDRPAAHFAGHLDGLKPTLSLRETLGFWAALYGSRRSEAASARAAARVGLGHALDLPVGVLSAGQRRRAGLARLLIAPRPLWLLDEPTSTLDRDGETLLAELLGAHLDNGGTVIAATHQALPLTPDAVLDMTALQAA